MTLETIYYIGQTVAVIAILVSLIFVGIQMRDGNRLARAQMHQDISDSFIQLVMTLPDESDTFFEAWFSLEAYKKLGRRDTEMLTATMLALWKYFENVYYQHKNGFVDEEYFQSTTKFMSIFLAREGIRFWWDGRKAVFATEFITFVETLKTSDMPVDMKAILQDKPVPNGGNAGSNMTQKSEEPST